MKRSFEFATDLDLINSFVEFTEACGHAAQFIVGRRFLVYT